MQDAEPTTAAPAGEDEWSDGPEETSPLTLPERLGIWWAGVSVGARVVLAVCVVLASGGIGAAPCWRCARPYWSCSPDGRAADQNGGEPRDLGRMPGAPGQASSATGPSARVSSQSRVRSRPCRSASLIRR